VFQINCISPKSKAMTRNSIFSACFFFSIIMISGICQKSYAQDWQKNIEDPSNFYSIQKAYYSSPDYDFDSIRSEEDGPDELFKRWENFTLGRINPDGSSFAPNIVYKEWTKYLASRPMYKKQNKNGDWTYTGPVVAPGNAGGTGRVNCIAFTPGNPNIMWAGTPSGGLWKSTDFGLTWTTNTDNIPNLGVTDIAINPRHPDTMFIATGDGYGYSIPNGMYFGGYYSNGIMRSINGGETWDTTTLNWDRAKARQIFHIVLCPDDPNVVIAVTNNGIWRTKDGGNNWTNVLASSLGKFTDIKMNIKDHSTFYAGGTSLFVTHDTGTTWSKVNISYPIIPGAMSLATCPSSDSVLYILALTGMVASSGTYILKSSDGGKTWKTMSAVTNTTKFQGYYDASIGVNPKDENMVSVGGLNILRSGNGGSTWSQITYDFGFPNAYYVHPDHRIFIYYPGSKDTVFDANDGGLYMSANGGTSWRLISGGIHALELYRIGSQAYDPSLLYTGAQDNGVNQMYNNRWTRVIGGDGMTCQVSWDDPATAYGCWQYGNIQKTTNYGVSWFSIYPPGAGYSNWTTPVVLDPVEPSTIYYGSTRVYKSTDAGNSWTSISNPVVSAMHISNIAVASADNKTIYISLGSEQSAPASYPYIWKTTDGGTTWSMISKSLTSATTYLTGISIDRRNPKVFAFSLAGYNNGQKVYITYDGGATYTNISAGLPNLPVNCVAFENSNENGIFVGTDAGIFYKNDITGGWIPYNNGLPNVMIDQIEVFPAAYKIRAATYGRGVWDGSLAGTISGVQKTAELNIEISVYPNPSASGIFNIDLPKYNYHSPSLSIFNIMGQKVYSTGMLQPENNSTTIDLSMLSSGMYTINLNYPDGVVTKKIQLLK
jgi:photosystem II stability/assembly factor-like uncharacterized protein